MSLAAQLNTINATELLDVYRQLKAEARQDPHINPVARLASELFLALEADAASIDDLERLGRKLNDVSFEERARAFHTRRSGAPEIAAVLSRLAAQGFEAFRAAVEGAATGVVFTAHPTFALGSAKRALIARLPAVKDEAGLEQWRAELAALADKGIDDITLRYEHDHVRIAIANAQSALRHLNQAILKTAREHFPQEWTTLTPDPISVASWVGYDLDGRSDIRWSETIRIRIAEKAEQLRRYADEMGAISKTRPEAELGGMHETLLNAAACAEKQAAAFNGNLEDPNVVVKAANLLTADETGRLVTLAPIIEALTTKIDAALDDETKTALMLLRAEMQAFGLGLARIHLRVNASQVRSALRADLGLDPDTGFMGRSALDIAAQKTTAAKKRMVNFGSVFLEKMTARRQLMLCAQILKHVDSETPIRFLIAECEAPATVMGAIYLARLYGVDHKLDISPLFETPQALESGGRFLERLLREPEYKDYVTRRGRMSIQLGFSDSGRFMGQCAAGLAVERLQVLFARALAESGMTHIEALIFNTHGESMGRGAHQSGFTERLNHLATPWVHSRFGKDNIRLSTECSFQGGEGFVHFQTTALASETLTLLFTHSTANYEADLSDRYYADINYSWDFYRGLKSWQEALFNRDDYRQALSGFALRFLYKTGSRQTKRAKSGGFDLSALRAIPHNAILQPLGVPVNVSGGFGFAAGREADRLVEHIKGSERMRELSALAAKARALTDLSVLRAYAMLYAPDYWSSLAVAIGRGKRADSYERAQQALGAAEISAAYHRLTDYLSQDLRRFDAILSADCLPEFDNQPVDGDRMCVLHALRQALMAKAVSLISGAPPFSRRHDINHRDLITMTLEWRLSDAIDQLKIIFPAKSSRSDEFSDLREKVDNREFEGGAYPEIHTDIIEPLQRISDTSHTITQAIANHYGAFG